MTRQGHRRVDFPLSGEGPVARAARPHAARQGPDPAGRPSLRHRERAFGLRSGGAGLPAEVPLPDADEERAAGASAHAVRRRRPIRFGSRPTARRRPAATSGRPRAGPRSSGSSPPSVPTSCAVRRGCLPRRATASRTSRRRSSRSSISPRSPRSRPLPARPFIRCASAATSTSPAGRPGTSSTCVGREIAIGPDGPAEDRQADRALRGDQRRSRHRHPRPGHPAHPDADVRACRLRGLRRGGRGRSDRGGR